MRTKLACTLHGISRELYLQLNLYKLRCRAHSSRSQVTHAIAAKQPAGTLSGMFIAYKHAITAPELSGRADYG